MSSPTTFRRKRGTGSINYLNGKWHAWLPQHEGLPRKLLCARTFYHQAEKELNAWLDCVGELTVRRTG